MSELPITVACRGYDRVQGLMDGRVRIEGCAATFLPLGPEEAFFRAFSHAEFEVSELSLSTYLVTLARGEAAYVALPVFLSRMFRHSAVYIRTDRGIERPEDLKGRLVGVPEYQVTAALWVRGMLQDEYGVAPTDLRWRTGGVEDPGRREKVPLQLPADLECEPIGEGETLSQLLESGGLDALVAPRPPSCFSRGAPHVGRLFSDTRRAERAYYEKTRLFPIMHVVGVRRDLVEAHPWLAASVFKAFRAAKDLAVTELSDTTALQATLPWLAPELEETRALMGRDFWPYGVEANRATLEALLRYSFEQGLSPRRLAVEELFAPTTLESARI